MKGMGNKRKSISLKIRSEVLKRDSFKCQYCGQDSDTTRLEVDHIKPVTKGGTNDILNLITSCFECNRGKGNRELDDDSVVVKQKKQLDLLQERRNKLSLQMDWKQGLSGIDDEIRDKVVDYMKNKCSGIDLSPEGIKYLSRLIKKYEIPDILESIDISADKYLRFDGKDVTEESCKVFINKIGGILVNKNRSPVQNKISYLIGIGRNKFSYFNEKMGYTLLTTYVNRLKTNELSDEEIFGHLQTEIQPKTIEFGNWTQWRQFFETQISQIEEQSKRDYETEHENQFENSFEYDEVTEEILDEIVESLIRSRESLIPTFVYLGKGIQNFSCNNLLKSFDQIVGVYLDDLYYQLESGWNQNELTTDMALVYENIILPTDSKLNASIKSSITHIIDSCIMRSIHLCPETYRIKPDHFKYLVEGYNSHEKTQDVTEEMKEQNFYVCNDVTEELLDSTFDKFISLRPYVILGIEHISQGFDGFNKDELIKDIDRIVLNYLNAMTEFLLESGEMDEPILEVQLSDFHWSILDKETIFYEVIEVTILDIFSRWWREGSLFELESGYYKVEYDHYDYLCQKYHRLVVMSEES
jgi:hypothetical protein